MLLHAALVNPLVPAVHPIAVKSFLTYLYSMLVWSNGILGSSFSRGSDGNGLQSKCFRLWSSAMGLKEAQKYIVLQWLLNLLLVLLDKALLWHYQHFKIETILHTVGLFILIECSTVWVEQKHVKITLGTNTGIFLAGLGKMSVLILFIYCTLYIFTLWFGP